MHEGMVVVDGHADILYELGRKKCSFYDPAAPLQQSYEQLRQSGVDLQVFVTFVDPDVTASGQLYAVLDSLDRFRRDVERPGIVETILTRSDLNRMESGLREGDATRYALLSVEGAEAIDGRMAVLEAWFRLGVRLVGLTWNGANCVADGVGELRGGGLTGFGREVVARMQELGMVVDVSHLSVRGVSDVLDMTVRPVVASHSNALSVHRHRRNLDDDQIRGIAATGGLVGATFVPAFIASAETVTVDDLLRHVDHLLTVAGPDAVGLGSDFDGIETTPQGLRGGADYPALLDALQTRYGDDVCHKLYGANWLRVLSAVLPA